MLDLHAAVCSAGDDGLDLPFAKVRTNGIGSRSPCRQGGRALGQPYERVICPAVCRFPDRQVEGERSSEASARQ